MPNYWLINLLLGRISNSLITMVTVAISIGCSLPVMAQVTPDDSLEEESSVVTPDVEVKRETADRIDGGAIRDRNLFHSFSEFNVGESQRVYFANPDNIEQIFTRVTGSNPSNIDGTLGVDGAADLLLLNPNGILFGENSSLDVEGSFFGTSADSILFEDDAEFSAVNPNSSLLTVSVPLGLQIGNNPGAISVRSSLLEVPNGQNFSLVGGEINLNGINIENQNGINIATDRITSPGGQVELGGLSTAGRVDFKDSSNLSFPENVPRANITLDNFSLDASAGGGGYVALYSQNLRLLNSFLVTGIDFSVEATEAQAGDIVIDTTEATTLESSNDSASGISNTTGDLSEFSEAADAAEVINTAGNAGNIFINTDSLSATGTFLIGSLTNGKGNAGNVSIKASGSVSLNSLKPLDLLDPSTIAGIISGVAELGTGNGADIKIDTPSLSLNNASISTSTTNAGNAGNTLISATDSVIANDSLIIAEATGSGNGANVEIDTRSLSANNTRISTSTIGTGNAGDVLINAIDSSDFLNTTIAAETLSSGDAGNIIFESETANISLEQTIISTSIFTFEEFTGTGKGGNITVKGRNFSATNSAVSTTTAGEVTADGLANAGNIELNISDSIVISSNSRLSTNTIGEGNAGNLNVNTSKLTIEDSFVNATNSGSGNAGNINIGASEFINLSGISEIPDGEGTKVPSGLFTLTTSGSATAGDVTINTEQFRIADGAQIQANTQGAGDGGSITIEANKIELLGSSEANFPSAIFADTTGTGNGGKVDISTNDLLIEDGAEITVSSVGDGNAGSFSAQVRDSLEVNNGFISSFSDRSSGGEIDLAAGNIRLRGDSDIVARVKNGTGGGGNITLSADSIVAFDDSDIIADSADGKGGNITLNTNAFFASPYNSAFLNANPQFLDNNNRVDLSATGSISGVIDLPEVNFLPSDLVKLSEETIDSDEVVANSCVVRDGKPGGTFIVTGSDGLPVRPGDAAGSDYSTGTVRSIPDTQELNSAEDSWQPGDAIAEPEGAYRLSNGKLVLSRECR